jgi:serine/threonine protein kinase
LDILLNDHNKPIGYTMKYLTDTYQLVRLFTKKFRDVNNIKPNQILKLVQHMQNVIHKNIHPNRILLVDINENNFLVDKQFKTVHFIDVDSYQTPFFPATALMESVRDRHTKGFNENSDWFSFAVLSFQMFIGIHPFRGTHKTIQYPANLCTQESEYPDMTRIIRKCIRVWLQAGFSDIWMMVNII